MRMQLRMNLEAVERKEVDLQQALDTASQKQSRLDTLIVQNTELSSTLAKQQFELNERERQINLRFKQAEDFEKRLDQTLDMKMEERRAELESEKDIFIKEKEQEMKNFASEYQSRLKNLSDEFAFVEVGYTFISLQFVA